MLRTLSLLASLFLASLLLSSLPLSTPTHAQSLSRDVRLIIPFAPGGTVDLLGRMLAEGLGPDLSGRTIVVENRSGAGTFIAMQALVNAPADGHTLSLAAGTVLATAPIVPGNTLPLDPDRALAPVMNLIRVPIVLVGRGDAPYATLPDLITYAKANPGRLNIGQSGNGSLTHLLAARFGAEAGIALEQIQYRGGTPALLDILSGNADLYFSLLPESLPFIREGRLRAIAFASAARNSTLPDIALMQDRLPGFVGDVAYGLVAAAATPPEWVAFWNARINAYMARPEVRQRMRDLLWVPVNGSAEAYRAEIVEDRRVWGAVIRAADIRAGG